MRAIADRVARRPWTMPLFVVGGTVTCLDIWWLISSYHDPRVRVEWEPMFLGLSVPWIAIGVFLLGPICVGTALYRLLTD